MVVPLFCFEERFEFVLEKAGSGIEEGDARRLALVYASDENLRASWRSWGDRVRQYINKMTNKMAPDIHTTRSRGSRSAVEEMSPGPLLLSTFLFGSDVVCRRELLRIRCDSSL